jgi:hypothetical protein
MVAAGLQLTCGQPARSGPVNLSAASGHLMPLPSGTALRKREHTTSVAEGTAAATDTVSKRIMNFSQRNRSK